MARAVTAPLRPRCATRGTAQRARTERAVALCLALGLDDRLIALLRQRLDEADLVEGDLVVRAVAGSSDARAVADCRVVAAGLAAASGRVVAVGYLSAASPPLDAGPQRGVSVPEDLRSWNDRRAGKILQPCQRMPRKAA